MSQRKRGPEEPWLFDLPLGPPEPEGGEASGVPAPEDRAAEAEGPPGEAGEGAPARRRSAAAQRPAPPASLPLFPDDEASVDEAGLDDTGLDDTSLDEGADEAPVPPHRAAPAAAPPRSASRPAPPAASTAVPPRPHPVPEPPPGPSSGPLPARRRPQVAGLRPRLVAALADSLAHLVVLAVGWAACALLGVPVGAREIPAFALYLLAFSFLYSVVSLAFWGRTPGMTAAGVVARSGDDQPLTFGQTGLRWIAGLLTAALAGLPLLLALSGRSLADRLSGSETYELR